MDVLFWPRAIPAILKLQDPILRDMGRIADRRAVRISGDGICVATCVCFPIHCPTDELLAARHITKATSVNRRTSPVRIGSGLAFPPGVRITLPSRIVL